MKSAPDVVVWGAWDETVSEDAVLGSFYSLHTKAEKRLFGLRTFKPVLYSVSGSLSTVIYA